MNICINGSRTFKDYNKLEEELNKLIPNKDNIQFILGGASGADSLAEQYAIKHNIPYKLFKPDWNLYGKKAGILRNIDMINVSNKLISFWDGQSKGTKHTIEYAQSKLIEVVIIRV